MKKKRIIKIIIGLLLAAGVGYAIYSEVQRNKQDYFLISYKGNKETIVSFLRKEKIDIIEEYEMKDIKMGGIKTYTTFKKIEKITKKNNIRFINLVNGLEKDEKEKVEIYVPKISNNELNELKEKIKNLGVKELTYSEGNYSVVCVLDFEQAEKLKKEKNVFSVLKFENIIMDYD